MTNILKEERQFFTKIEFSHQDTKAQGKNA